MCHSFHKNVFESLPQKPILLKSHSHAVTSTSGANLGLIGQCHLTFKWGKMLHRQIYSSQISFNKFSFMIQLSIQLQNWLHLKY